MGFTHNLGTLAQGVFSDSSLNIGIGGAPSGSFKFEVTGTGKFSGALTATSATFANTTALGIATQTTAGLYNGVAASASGSSFFTKTGSLSSSFSSGFGVDGTYSSGLSIINLRAIGTQTAGGYASTMHFVLDNDGVQRNHAIFSSDGSTTLYGALSGTSATFTGTSGASSTRLTLQGTGNGWNNQYITNTGGALWLGVMRDDGIAPFTGGTAFAGYIGTSNSTNFIITTAAIPRLTATSGGNVLIGTTTDAGYKLDVNAGGGSVRFNGTIGDKLVLYNSGNNGGTNGIYIDSDIYPAIRFNNRVGFAGTAKIVYNTYATGYGAASLNGSFIMQGPNALQFSSGGDNVRLTIASTGEATFSNNIQLGTTAGTLRIGTNAGDFATFNYSGGGTSVRNDWASTSAFLDLLANSVGFRVSGTGSATLTGVLVQGVSDERFKKNIKPISNALEKIKSINGYTFEYDLENEDLTYIPKLGRDIGVIAQEIEKIIPEAVSLAPIDRNDQGNSKSGKNYLTVNYEKIIPLLIQAIKEQQAEIDILKNN
jgi:hypothetical protein